MSVTFNSKFGQVMKRMTDGTAARIIAPVAIALKDDIVAATPSLTGETKDSIVAEQHSKFGWTIYTPLLKAVYIEYGTEDTPKFAMFRGTFNAQADKIARKLEADFKKEIETISV